MTRRFSKSLALAVLDANADDIAENQGFDRGNGTSQLHPKDRLSDAQINRAVEYGRMRAFEQFAKSIEDGFRFDQVSTGASQ